MEHQERMARRRGTPIENARAGMELDRPAIDFAAAARAQGWHAEGPIEDPIRLGEAVARAAAVVATEKRPALVDVRCQDR